MKIIIDIKDSKAEFILELLKNFSFVKAKPITPYKAKVLENIKDGIEEMKLIKAGKKKSKPLSEFLDEL